LAIQIKADFDEGKELIVAVLSVSYSYFIQLRSSKIISLIFLTLVTGGGGGGSFFSIESKLEKMAGMIYF
jgi:hypothetical protein